MDVICKAKEAQPNNFWRNPSVIVTEEEPILESDDYLERIWAKDLGDVTDDEDATELAYLTRGLNVECKMSNCELMNLEWKMFQTSL